MTCLHRNNFSRFKNNLILRNRRKDMKQLLLISFLLACLLQSISTMRLMDSFNKSLELEDKKAKNGTVEPKILFVDPDDVEMTYKVKDLKNNFERNVTLILNKRTVLESKNVTLEQLKEAWIEISREGKEEIIVAGKRFELDVSLNTVIVLQSSNGSRVAIDINHFLEQKMENIEGDPTLIPMDPLVLSWNPPTKCNLGSITLQLNSFSFRLKINQDLKLNYSLELNETRGKVFHPKDEGLILAVINPRTCKTTLDLLTYTSDVGGYRDLHWGLKSILPGKLILLASLRDGASFLNKGIKYFIQKLGSSWSPFYLYRDAWIHLFVKGGKTLHDVLVPNLGRLNTSGSPFELHLNTKELVEKSEDFVLDCPFWPSSERWEARKVFCEDNDGFSNLCSCEKPFEFEDGKGENDENRIPLIFIIGNRTRHLYHLFESLAPQENITKDLILLVSDGHYEQSVRLALVLGLKLLVHRPEGEGAVLISRNLRFALYQGLKLFPKARSFILLEDDLLVSPDFYSFMKQMEPIFEIDKTVMCVSAFNHLSYPHTSLDPSLTYRVESYPAYGWMMPRLIIEEILPKWMPSNFSHDWDYFIGSDFVQRDRECVVPDINRSFHWSTKGFHLQASYFSEILFLSRTMNKNPKAKVYPLDRLIKENYEMEFENLLQNSTVLPFKERSDLDKVISPGKSYMVFVQKKNESDVSSFKLFGEELEIWNLDARDHHNSAWRLFYNNATLFVIGYPMSPYKKFIPKDHPILSGDASTDREINSGESLLRAQHRFLTHANNSYLPFSFVSVLK